MLHKMVWIFHRSIRTCACSWAWSWRARSLVWGGLILSSAGCLRKWLSTLREWKWASEFSWFIFYQGRQAAWIKRRQLRTRRNSKKQTNWHPFVTCTSYRVWDTNYYNNYHRFYQPPLEYYRRILESASSVHRSVRRYTFMLLWSRPWENKCT